MKLIPSFTVDHTKIVPGIYESRVDVLGEELATTFDVRMRYPNREPAIDPAAMHSFEHLVATFLRNHPDWKDELIYWGPMGCMTGCISNATGKACKGQNLRIAAGSIPCCCTQPSFCIMADQFRDDQYTTTLFVGNILRQQTHNLISVCNPVCSQQQC